MSTQYTIGEYLLDRLKELGIHHIFGVPGDYAFPLLDLIEDDNAMAWIGNCNELNAAYAADSYAHIHGIAALVVTCGVGELSASCGVAGSYAEQVPVVAIVGYPPTRAMQTKRATHHSLDADFTAFARIYQEFTVAQAVLTKDNACQEMDRVLVACWSQKRPVYIQLPSDIEGLPAQPPSEKLMLPEPSSDPVQLAAFLEHLLPLLAAARHPVLLADFVVGRYHLTEQLQTFAERSGIPFAATGAAKTAFFDETHPQYLGTYRGGLEDGSVEQQIKEADLLLRLGIQLSEANTKYAALDFQGPQVVDIQIRSASIGSSHYPDVALHDVLTQLSSQVPHRDYAFRSLQSRTTSQTFVPQGDTRITQERLWQRLSQFLQVDDVVAIDQGTCVGTTGIALPARAKVVMQWTWDAIGYALPAVLGAYLADQHRRHILVIGDGAFQTTAQELSTILRQGLAPIMLLLNNGNYLVENALRRNDTRVMHYNELQVWSYHRLAADFACTHEPVGIRVCTEEELEVAFTTAAQAQSQGRAVFIEVLLAHNDVSQLTKEVIQIP